MPIEKSKIIAAQEALDSLRHYLTHGGDYPNCQPLLTIQKLLNELDAPVLVQSRPSVELPSSEVFAYAAKEVEKDLSGAVEIMKGGAA